MVGGVFAKIRKVKIRLVTDTIKPAQKNRIFKPKNCTMILNSMPLAPMIAPIKSIMMPGPMAIPIAPHKRDKADQVKIKVKYFM